jgi:4-amino-4-deoxy-L-arabinose transferase-like glycosyltransferase
MHSIDERDNGSDPTPDHDVSDETIDRDDHDAVPDPKPWYASTGVWGAAVTLGGSLLALMKVQLDPQLLDDVRQWVLSLVTLIGGGVALWGRIRATRRIGKPARAATLGMIFIGACGLAISSAGCATTLDGAFARADRATFDAVAPEYAAYVASDPWLTTEQRERRQRTVELWRLRVEDEQRRAQADELATDGAPMRTD